MQLNPITYVKKALTVILWRKKKVWIHSKAEIYVIECFLLLKIFQQPFAYDLCKVASILPCKVSREVFLLKCACHGAKASINSTERSILCFLLILLNHNCYQSSYYSNNGYPCAVQLLLELGSHCSHFSIDLFNISMNLQFNWILSLSNLRVKKSQ